MPFHILRAPLLARTTLAVLASLCSVAQAHIVLDQKSAPAGSYYKAVLRVGHGCDGAATTAITVRMPPGVQAAHPQPKPGWTLDIRRAAEGGEVSDITWRGGQLPDAWYDEFALQVKLPNTPGPLWFKVLQQCGDTSTDWAEVPATGTVTRGLRRPAALLEVQPAAGAAAAMPDMPGMAAEPAAAHQHHH
ncbi:YcnI family protein [Xylophilus sp. GW821-FHT01B05]